VALFYGLRQIERWLHQHIFKVGWLVLKDFQRTTLLYYTFFLPGVIINQLVYWLMAGVLDVRAERAIRLPEKQEIGELKLNFIKLSKKASPARVSIITITPFLAGLFFILFAMNNIFQVNVAFADFDGTLDSVLRAIGRITSAPDFWLWAYLLFTVANTMMPDFKQIRGLRIIFTILGVVMLVLFVIGVGDEIASAAITGPILTILNTLSGAFAFVIILDVVAVGILALIENSIEYLTGDSATFKNGKMIAMTREQVVASRNQERQKRMQSLKEPKQLSPLAGAPSIYKLPFPIPGAPGVEPITSVPSAILSAPPPPPALDKRTVTREEPKVITVAPVNEPPKPPMPPPRAIVFGGTSAFKDNEDADEEDEDDDDIRYEDAEDSP
jgi:hypothetical protein